MNRAEYGYGSLLLYCTSCKSSFCKFSYVQNALSLFCLFAATEMFPTLQVVFQPLQNMKECNETKNKLYWESSI